MTTGSSSALGTHNQILVCGDGPELLVYEAPDGKPVWKEFCDDILVSVGVSSGQVISVDAGGRVVRWQNGGREQESQVGTEINVVEIAESGSVALANSSHLWLPRGNDYFQVAFDGAVGLSFDGSGMFVAAVSATGQLVVIRLVDGVVVGTSSIPGGGRDVCWSATENWCVAANGSVQLYSSDGASQTKSIALAGDVQRVACSKDGSLLSCLVDGQAISIIEILDFGTVGSITFKRAVMSLSFGGGATLCVGLDDGEANTIELSKGSSTRTEPHIGRGRTNWNFKSTVDYAQVRGLIARAKADGGPVASFVYKKPKDGKKRSGCMTAGIVLFVLWLVCSGCFGATGIGYYFFG